MTKIQQGGSEVLLTSGMSFSSERNFRTFHSIPNVSYSSLPFLCINSESGQQEYFTFTDNMTSGPPPDEPEVTTLPHHETTAPLINRECELRQTHDCIDQPFDEEEYTTRYVRKITHPTSEISTELKILVLLHRERSESADTCSILSDCLSGSNEMSDQTPSESSSYDFDDETMSQASPIQTKRVKTAMLAVFMLNIKLNKCTICFQFVFQYYSHGRREEVSISQGE